MPRLFLASNELKGDIPHELSKLSLVTFDVSDNKLGGPLVTEIGLMSHLEVLRFNDNRLSGDIPTELGKLKHLNVLSMSGNEFSGNLPSELSELVSLGKTICRYFIRHRISQVSSNTHILFVLNYIERLPYLGKQPTRR